ncbi:MarR family transcriptional regulator [Maribacter algarum]|uniref:MarR family transcriptional regulator n=1 Tax=Maribacter algarum (ex Zhang et al. 2020) TaxID=2578118 RepID=A0A5S3PDT2_9FLAO|nr:MarR family transcriptional regulator [Maribacter algarum]TMM52116.1 MarR family transcriptional regulator [Maribacter algarum]
MKKEFDLIDFEKSIGPWLGKTVKIVDYYLQEAFQNAGLDLTKEQMIVLKKLHEKDGLNQNELAFLTYRDKSSLARLLAKMESKKYVVRKQSAEDKRSNEVFLTKEGREMFKRTRPVIKSIMDVMEQDISKKEKQQIIGILKKVQFSITAKVASL